MEFAANFDNRFAYLPSVEARGLKEKASWGCKFKWFVKGWQCPE